MRSAPTNYRLCLSPTGVRLNDLSPLPINCYDLVRKRFLALVDEQAKREGESRSGLLARAVLEYIGRHEGA